MSILKAINRKAPFERGCDYVLRKAVIADSINCRAETFFEECRVTQSYYCKNAGREYFHFVKSYPPNEVSAAAALAETKELVERNPDLEGFEVLLAAHDDCDHCHVHILVNAVCAIDGHKLHISKKQYRDVWLSLNREIDIEHNRSITERKKKSRGDVTTDDKRKFEVIKRRGADSDIGHVYMSVIAAMRTAKNWNDFERLLLANDIRCVCKATRKHVVFEYNGHRFRDKNLSRTFSDEISKARFEYEFDNRRREENDKREIEDFNRETDEIVESVEKLLLNVDDREKSTRGENRRATTRAERYRTKV